MTILYRVEVKLHRDTEDACWTAHTTCPSYSDAVNQADMVHGRVVVDATGLPDRDAWEYAKSQQGFQGDFAEWQTLDDDERNEYEFGAAA